MDRIERQKHESALLYFLLVYIISRFSRLKTGQGHGGSVSTNAYLRVSSYLRCFNTFLVPVYPDILKGSYFLRGMT